MSDQSIKPLRHAGKHAASCSVCSVLASGRLPKRYILIHEFSSSVAVLAPNQYYPGRCELWCKYHAEELFDLTADRRRRFHEELTILAKAVSAVLHPRKFNYELLGNTVPHLHWHLVPRYDWDDLPRRPIWENPAYVAIARKSCAERPQKLALAEKLAHAVSYYHEKGHKGA
jgi:diadenosine tetraphosphate (Ap4A) HIT family hydrolase